MTGKALLIALVFAICNSACLNALASVGNQGQHNNAHKTIADRQSRLPHGLLPTHYSPEERQHNQVFLPSPLQDLQAIINEEGVYFESTSASEASGIFTFRLSNWGRPPTLYEVLPGEVARQDNAVYLKHKSGITQKFTSNSNGIRQDFIIDKKPGGSSLLTLDLEVSNAEAWQSNGSITISLAGGDRQFTYHSLLVTDYTGAVIPASMAARDNKAITISIDDRDAIYPLLVDPVISDADWQAMGDGSTGINGTVNDIAIDENDNLFIGGDFDQVNGVAINNIVQWDGSNWLALDIGTSGPVNAVEAVPGGWVAVGGDFFTAGGITVRNIAVWDGVAWIGIGGGLDSPVSDMALRPYENDLYMTGDFRFAAPASAHPLPVNHIVFWRPDYNNLNWTMGEWRVLASGLGPYVDGRAVAVNSRGHVYVGTESSQGVRFWNGSRWGIIPRSGTTHAIAIDRHDNVYAGGTFGIRQLSTGNAWAALGSGVNGDVYDAMFDLAGVLYAAGSFTSAGGVTANNLAQWDGSSWSAFDSGTNGPVNAIKMDSEGTLFVGGNFTSAGGNTSYHLASIYPNDEDSDGVLDTLDAFPADPTETTDTDGDGYGDNIDGFPLDPNEWEDTDRDGVPDNEDAFPLDPTEWEDTDGDGWGDNIDRFPGNPNEWIDSDGDGIGDNSDAFPDDPTQSVDVDEDGIDDDAITVSTNRIFSPDQVDDSLPDMNDFSGTNDPALSRYFGSDGSQEDPPIVILPKDSDTGSLNGSAIAFAILLLATRRRVMASR